MRVVLVSYERDATQRSPQRVSYPSTFCFTHLFNLVGRLPPEFLIVIPFCPSNSLNPTPADIDGSPQHVENACDTTSLRAS
ncbi:unnamed protein product [Trichobilharzia regenti]|nr:unnamed protein product [Trichobilharzia regenti]